MKFILASASPRRKELLANAGFDFEVQAGQIEEVHRPGETAGDYVARLARDKALNIARRVSEGRVVLGADTEVVVGGQILGKPSDADDAARMLRLLSGKAHEVTTGVCLVSAPERILAQRLSVTLVTFADLTEREIQEYAASGEPMDKAGAYAVQGLASKFVKHIEGSYSNVMGLPVHVVYEMFKGLAESSQ